MYLAPRGVRPLGQAGAFVAGADDFSALSYNPAGLARAGNSALVDFGYSRHITEYRRRVFADSPELAAVQGTGMAMPLPALGVTLAKVGSPAVNLGAGLWAPYPLLQNWPCDLSGHDPTPQRYSICNYNGTAMATGGVGVAYRVDPRLTVGAAVHVLVGKLVTEVVLSVCDGAVCTQAENPDYDAAAQVASSMLVSPALALGATLEATPWLRLGFSAESGYWVSGDAELRVRLPTTALFAGAELDPASPRARVRLRLPPMVRLGAEGHWGGSRAELAVVYEAWRVHDSIEVSADAVMRDVIALGDYPVGTIRMDRGFRDAFSVRLGGELDGGQLAAGLVLRGGVMAERSAVPAEKLTAMNVDLNRLIVTLGVSYALSPKWSLEGVFAYVAMPATTVTTSTLLQTNATRPPWPGRTPVGNGVYQSQAEILGFGAKYAWQPLE